MTMVRYVTGVEGAKYALFRKCRVLGESNTLSCGRYCRVF